MALLSSTCCWRAPDLSRKRLWPLIAFECVSTCVDVDHRHADMEKVRAVFKRMFQEPHAKVRTQLCEADSLLCCVV